MKMTNKKQDINERPVLKSAENSDNVRFYVAPTYTPNDTCFDEKSQPNPDDLLGNLQLLTSIVEKYAQEVQCLRHEIDLRNQELLQKAHAYSKLDQENIRIKSALSLVREGLASSEKNENSNAFARGRLITIPDHIDVSDHQVGILGSGSSVISGDDGTSISEDGSMSISGVGGISISEKDSSSISGDAGVSISRLKSYSSSKKAGISISGDEGTSTAGDDGFAISGKNGISEVGDRGTAVTGIGGACSAGHEGIIVSKFWDIHLMKICTLIAYIGQNGIKPHKYYTIDSGVFIEVSKPTKENSSQMNDELNL